jgi:tetratricopeptide (TPR) repeat protein
MNDMMRNSGSDPKRYQSGLAIAHAHYANLRAALDYALRTRQPLDSIVGALDEMLYLTQQNDARRQLLDDTIAACTDPAGEQQLAELAQLHNLAGDTAHEQRRYDDAAIHFEAEIPIRQAINDQPKLARAYYNLGVVAQDRGSYAEAEAAFLQGLAIMLELGDRRAAAKTYQQLGWVALAQNRLHEAGDHYRQALELYLVHGDRHTAAHAYQGLGKVAERWKRFAEAKAAYDQALTIFLDFSDQSREASISLDQGRVALEQKQFAGADAWFRQALDVYLALNDQFNAGTSYYNLGTVAEARERFTEAEAAYRKAIDILRDSDLNMACAATGGLGRVLVRLDRHDEAVPALIKSTTIFRQLMGYWPSGDLQLVRNERGLLASAQFAALVEANVPADLLTEFWDAMDEG